MTILLRLTLLGSLLALVACSKTPVRTTTVHGVVEGYLDAGVEHYLGIPYAAPPLGDLRWRPPSPVSDWEGVLQARDNPETCVQFRPLSDSVSGSENCLFVNVWTPGLKPEESMPVMVWIHGGGFTVGQGSYTNSDGRTLADRENVVVVTLNYRLGVFGFLAHAALIGEDPSHPTSGNYGLQDQIAALRWVRDNISAFGGDPDNVTIFGQSAGGVSVCAQLASPEAEGLFHRAVIQSAPCGTPLSTMTAVSEALGTKLETGLGCDSAPDPLACMRGKRVDTVAAVMPPDPGFAFGEGYEMWWPVIDGHTLPLQFTEAFASGRFNRVPVINGATKDEASLLIWLSHNFRFNHLEENQYPDRLEYLLGSAELAEQVAERYPIDQFGTPFNALTESFSDGFFNCFALQQSEDISRHTPTWAYQFDYQDAPFLIPWADLEAYHSAEIQYIFGRRMSLLGGDFPAKEQPLADSMMRYWANFARSGNPNGSGLMQWPAYDHRDQTLLFDLQNSVATAVHREACEFWRDLPYRRPAYPRIQQ